MKNEFITIKIWRKTLPKIRLVAAIKGRSMVSIIDELVEKEKTKHQKALKGMNYYD